MREQENTDITAQITQWHRFPCQILVNIFIQMEIMYLLIYTSIFWVQNNTWFIIPCVFTSTSANRILFWYAIILFIPTAHPQLTMAISLLPTVLILSTHIFYDRPFITINLASSYLLYCNRRPIFSNAKTGLKLSFSHSSHIWHFGFLIFFL